MSNNPSKKGKPAAWIVREQESRAIALQRFLEEQLPAYATWRQSQHEQFRSIDKLADIPAERSGRNKPSGLLSLIGGSRR